jgi:hypothetical protein
VLRVPPPTWLLLIAVGCTSSTKAAPPPTALWQASLAEPIPSGEGTALAIDFRRHQVNGLGGKLNTWMQWMDERSPGASVEAMPNLGSRDAILVKARIGDGKEVVCAFDFTRARSAMATTLFDATVLGTNTTTLPGLHVRLGETDFGPLEVDLRAEPECTLGLDVLGQTVLVVPLQGKQPVWLMVASE